MLESDLSVEGEFLSEKAMREDKGFSVLLSSHKNQQYLLFVTPLRPSPGLPGLWMPSGQRLRPSKRTLENRLER